MATDGKLVYAANSDNVTGIAADTSFASSPGMYALDLITGKIAWKTPSPGCQGNKNCMVTNSAAPVAMPGLVFAGALDGVIRAYNSENGEIVWQYNTLKEFESSMGDKGRGGAIDGPSPVVADGMLFVNSGYGMFGQIPGNVLLAFAVKK
jgi:polyvinyl alcohol dehydrogenase (cytochrome)